MYYNPTFLCLKKDMFHERPANVANLFDFYTIMLKNVKYAVVLTLF